MAGLGCLVLVLALALGTLGTPATAGKPLFRCPRDDRLSQCTAAAFLDIIAAMQEGNPEYDIPKANPIVIPLMPVNKNAGAVLNLNMTIANLQIDDMVKNVIVKSAKFDLDTLRLELDLHRPSVDFHGHYRINGKILWLPLWGTGTMWLKMRDVNEKFHLVGERVSAGGKPRWTVKDYSSSLLPGFMSLHYDNLFNGNWLLGRGANALMNAQWKVIYEQLHPITDAHFSRIMKPHWDKILAHVDLDESFPAPAA